MTVPIDKSPAIKSQRHPLDGLCINTIRTLAIDAIQAANSGHPGTPMAMAPVGYYLWQYVLRFDPQDPIWPNRDRFVLSAGHASMLLYALLHLTGVRAVSKDYERLGEPSVPLEAIKTFRQWHSRCPGHPEYRWTSGVETTTGPLGQGLANSVGMAMAGRWMAARYNRPGFEDLIDFNVYALCGDGCMMEGISSEAASLAAHLEALQPLLDLRQQPRHDRGEHRAGLQRGRRHPFPGLRLERHPGGRRQRSRPARPRLQRLPQGARAADPDHRRQPHRLGRAPQAGHQRRPRRAPGRGGSPADQAQLPLARGRQVPRTRRGLRALPRRHGPRGKELRDAWFGRVERYRAEHPDLADELYRMQHRQLPDGWDSGLPAFAADRKGMATRNSSGLVLNAIARNVPWLVGGAADLAPSTKTRLTFDGAGDFEAGDYGGRNLHFGIREHAMGAILNGMALVKVRAYGSGFLIFSDYGRMPIRLAAIMEIPVIYVFTHDSIGVGEDGPTHQPIEQLPSLRRSPA